MDRDAKRFAAAILMPGDAVLSEARKLYPQLVRVVGYGNAAAVISTMTSRLAKTFEVSLQAMGIRLKEWPAKVTERVTAAMADELDYF